MAKRKKQTRKPVKKKFDKAAFEKIEAMLHLAQEALFEQAFDSSQLLCQQVLKHRRANLRQKHEAHNLLGNLHAQRQDFTLSVAAFTEASRIKPNDWITLVNRGQSLIFVSRTVDALTDLEAAQRLCDDPEWQPKIDQKVSDIRDLVEEMRLSRGKAFTVDALHQQQTLFVEAFEAMVAGAHDRAIALFEEVIAMADVLPQPWFNIGSMHAMDGDYDSAEKAWLRALEIDPEYENAAINLKALPALRAGAKFDGEWITEPYKGNVPNISSHQL